MAIFPPKKGALRRPSFRGALLQDTTRGTERNRGWPEPKGSNQTRKQLEQQEWFRQANWAFKYIDPKSQQMFTRATHNTSLYPRDIATIMMAGGLFRLLLPDGKVAWPMPAILAVSESLDALSQTPGYTLIRGIDRWIGAPQNTPPGQLSSRFRPLNNLGVVTGSNTVPWGVAEWDELGMHMPSTPGFIRVPANVSRLSLGCQVRAYGGSATSFALRIFRNNIAVAEVGGASGYNEFQAQCQTGPISVAEGDTFEVRYQLSNASGKTMQASATNLWAKFG